MYLLYIHIDLNLSREGKNEGEIENQHLCGQGDVVGRHVPLTG
jgi:hypothetical protein